jgi:hypothetical protein
MLAPHNMVIVEVVPHAGIAKQHTAMLIADLCRIKTL